MNANFGEVFESLLGVDKKFMSRARGKAVDNLYEETKHEMVRGAESAKEALATYRNAKNGVNNINKSRVAAGGEPLTKGQEKIAKTTKMRTEANNANFGEMSAEEQIAAYTKESEKYDKSLKLNTAWESAKGYYSEPWKALGDKSLSDAQRGMAAKQMGARVAATAGGVALVGGIGHDLMSDNEDDTGVGGIAVNTIGAAGVTGGAALGLSFLKKL